jgi:type IV pilus assembly protein PilA
MRKQRGFSLIELLIVVAIILVIAALAIPSLLRARMAANDSSAAASMRQINTAEIAYFVSYPTVGYPSNLVTLGGTSPCVPSLTAACMLDDYLSTNGNGNGKSGYNFNAAGSASPGSSVNDEFLATGAPIGSTFGTRSYCSVEDAVIRAAASGTISVVPSYSSCQALSPLQQ